VTVSVLSDEAIAGYLRYGTDPTRLTAQTDPQNFAARKPGSIILGGLQPDTAYAYQFVALRPSGESLEEGSVSTFHTQRAPGSPFVFAIQADSHLDGATNPLVYQATLKHALAGKPDFLVDLGDTFMTDKHGSRDSAQAQYLAQRYYFGLICHSAPLFLVLGNHDGEQRRLAGDGESLAVWSNAMRKQYFPNPVPNEFYTGNLAEEPHAGRLENYYAWTWGDALFVVLDPFWYSGGRGNTSPWDRSLGEAQYQWLARTLSSSSAAHKFVFIHHLVGGNDKSARGGAEAANLFEWGGHELDGRYTFDTHRPDWPTPIHPLLVAHGVSIVFHGHDHFFMKQERDGVIYQLVPQPGHRGAGSARSAAAYGYHEGDAVTGSGHLRVQVAPEAARVQFVRTPLPRGEVAMGESEIAYEYSTTARPRTHEFNPGVTRP